MNRQKRIEEIEHQRCPKCHSKNLWTYNLQVCGKCDEKRILKEEGLL